MTTQTLTAATLIGMLALPASGENKTILGHDVYGNGPEKVIVFHDWMGDAANYDSVRPWLDTETYTYVFPEVRGYARSKDLTGEYNTEEIAADTMALADYLGWDRFHLVGHSMNGMAGFRTVMWDWQEEKRIKSYFAVTPVTPNGFPSDAETNAFLASTTKDDEAAKNAMAMLTGGKLNAAWSERKIQRLREISKPDVLLAYLDMWAHEDFSQELIAANIKTPITVLGGRNDLAGFQESYYNETIAKWLPNSSFEYIDNAGHYPMHETPLLFTSLMEAHLGANK